ncbi:14832_t:CDS:2, partial [Cetraspora pellucida]
QVLLGEKLIIEYRLPFLNGLELDAFFQKYRIALEVQGAQHRLHSTSWYKDVKIFEDVVNRDWKKKCICQDNGIFLLEVWYDEKPEIVIPERIQKIKEFINQNSKYYITTINHFFRDHGVIKNRWLIPCILNRKFVACHIHLYHGEIKKNEDTRKYLAFSQYLLKELLRRGIRKSGLSTTWLDNLMEE